MCSGRHHRPSHAPLCTCNQRRWLELVTPSTVHSGAGIVSLDVASVALVFWQPTVGACASSIAHRRAQGNLRERELPEICVARLATVQALRSLTIQVLELHRLDEIGVPNQVYLSTQFTSLYFLLRCPASGSIERHAHP